MVSLDLLLIPPPINPVNLSRPLLHLCMLALIEGTQKSNTTPVKGGMGMFAFHFHSGYRVNRLT